MKKAIFICFFGVVALLVAGLFLVGLVKANQQNLRQGTKIRPLVIQNGLADVRGQIHVHSYRSHDSNGSLADIVKAAKSSGVHWVILTDHVSSSKFADLLYPVNMDNVLLAFGKENGHASGGYQLSVGPGGSGKRLSILGHLNKIKSRDWLAENWNGLEIVNFLDNAKEQNWWKLLLTLNPYEKLSYGIRSNFQLWQDLSEARNKPVPIVAGPDAHENINVLGLQLDPYDVLFRLVSTHVFLEADKNSGSVELTEEKILTAIKRGRTYIAFDYLADSEGFSFAAVNGGNGKEYDFLGFTGDTVVNPEALYVKVPYKDAVRKLVELRMFKDNRLIYADKGCCLESRTPAEPGFWRVEVWYRGHPWIISGQILVK
ncbi:MAG: hypothetical protein Q8P76_03080 [bacterium]|nr:hypothetical protein [bacterium]